MRRDSRISRQIGRRWLRWVGGLAAVLVLPKCLLCGAGYLAVATGLMRAAPELCGANTGGFAGSAVTAMIGSVAALVGWLMFRYHRGVSAADRFVR